MRRNHLLIVVAAAFLALPEHRIHGEANAADHATGFLTDDIALAQNDSEAQNLTLIIRVTEGPEGDTPGAPISLARIILYLPGGVEMEGMTNSSGELVLDGLPNGLLKIQVVKTGWETAGSRIQLTQPQESLLFTLRPATPPTQ